MTKLPASQSDSGTVAIYTSEMKLTSTTDTAGPDITAFEMLPDGRQLTADKWNRKLKLYDSNNQFLSERVFPGCPWCIVLLSETEAFVSLPNIDSLQYVTVSKDPALMEVRKVNYKPFALVKYGDDLLATVLFDADWSVEVIDKHGKIKRTIYQDKDLVFSGPYSIALSVDQKSVYVSDIDNGCVGLSVDGNVVFQYDDQEVRTIYAGLALGRDCLFLGLIKEMVTRFDD